MSDGSGKAIDEPAPEKAPVLGANDVTRELELALEREVQRIVAFELQNGAGGKRAAYARATQRLRSLLSLLGAP